MSELGLKMRLKLLDRQNNNEMDNQIKKMGYVLALEDLDSLLCEQPQLNENQQVVSEWLKKEYKIGANPIASIFSVHNELLNDEFSDISESYYDLECIEELEVIKAFGAWVIEQEGE